VRAVERGERGIYNVVDDDPAPVAEWLPALAQTLGAKKPMRVPRFIGRLVAGEAGAVLMTRSEAPRMLKPSASSRGGPRTRAGGRGSQCDRARATALQELRPASFAIAYRMLGSVSEAEDVVQEALLRLA